MTRFRNKYIGDKHFYKIVLDLAIPIMIQNGITNFVNMLDNIMVGQVGTNQMTGVAIINQLIFVFNLCIFGAISGPGIFTAQFYGSGNNEGVRHTFRFKLIFTLIISIVSIFIFINYGDTLINAYLKGEGLKEDLAQSFKYAKDYLKIMLVGLIPFAIIQVYSGTLRETGETKVPMIAGIIAVIVNLILNYILIFGKIGIPAMGVRGAAFATVCSRFVELIYISTWTHLHKEKNEFIKGVFRTMYVPRQLLFDMLKKGLPLLVNEGMWAAGNAMFTKLYSLRGLAIVSALNISSTISNVFNVVFIAFGSVAAILLGQLLGANKKEEAYDSSNKLSFFTVVLCIGVGLFILFPLANIFPEIYNTTTSIKEISKNLIKIFALTMAIHGYVNAAYFTIRSGGKTLITFFFDSVFMWCLSIPTIFILTKYTNLNILYLYATCQLMELIKCIIGYFMLKSGMWLNNIVSE
jgi:putative MATE family efflux protein